MGFRLKKIGYKKPTLLQTSLAPLILQGKDVLIEVQKREGIFDAFVLPSLVKLAEPAKVTTLFITNNFENVRRISKTFDKFLSRTSYRLLIAALDNQGHGKKEHSLLAKQPGVIIGTTSKIIDHQRRGNINLAEIQLVILDTPKNPEEEGFDKDLQFIYSKLSNKRQTVLFLPTESNRANINDWVKKPVTLSAANSRGENSQIHYYLTSEKSGRAKTDLLRNILLCSREKGGVIFCQTSRQVQTLEAALLSFHLKPSLPGKVEQQILNTNEKESTHGNLLISSVLSDSLIQEHPHVFFFFINSAVLDFFTNSCLDDHHFTMNSYNFIISQDEEEKIKQLEERIKVPINRKNNPTSEEAVKGFLHNIIKIIKEEEDPDLLNVYKKQIKRHIPFTLRGYFSAYLLKEALQGKTTTTSTNGALSTLFISIGRNRKVFPKDLARFVASVCKIRPGEIKNIKVLDNYSFLDIPQPYAEKAINALNGKEYRGRNITINFAKKREPK